MPTQAMTFPAFAGPGKRQPPADTAGDDKAFGGAEHRAAKQKDGNGQPRRTGEAKRQKIEQSACDGRRQAGKNGTLGPSAIGVVAGPHARHECGDELAAGDKTDDKCAHAEALMHVQRQHGQRHSDDEKAYEHNRHDRQQCRRDRTASSPWMALMLLRTLFGTLQLIDRPDENSADLRRSLGREQSRLDLHYASSILGFTKVDRIRASCRGFPDCQ